jgi:limonene-1,2-epoxide hydrolase
MDENEKLVREFCKAWENPDWDALADYFTDDAVWHNIPFEPIRGKKGIRKVLETMSEFGESNFELTNVAVNGNVVFTERVDRFNVKGKAVAVPVCGVFEVGGGKITGWRDYFDYNQMKTQLPE